MKIKRVVAIWGIVYLLITALIYALNTWLVDLPIYLRTFILSGVMVFALQYVVFPFLNQFKLFQA